MTDSQSPADAQSRRPRLARIDLGEVLCFEDDADALLASVRETFTGDDAVDQYQAQGPAIVPLGTVPAEALEWFEDILGDMGDADEEIFPPTYTADGGDRDERLRTTD